MMQFLWNCRAFLKRDLIFETSYKLQSLFRLLSILFKVLTFYFLAQLVGGQGTGEHLAPYGDDYFTFALIGISFTGMFNAGIMNFTATIRQQLTIGVFEAMAATPIRSFSLLCYSMFFPMGFEAIKAFLYLLIGTQLLGAQVGFVDGQMLVITLALSIVVFASLGVIAGSLILYFKRGDPIAWFLAAATDLVGGVLFPITVLPDWLEVISTVIPVTWSLRALRACLMPAASTESLGHDLVVLGIFAVVLVPAAWLAATVVVEKARRDGSLGQY